MAQARKEIFTAIVNSTPRRVEEKHWNNAKEFIETFADEVLTDEILRNLVPDSTWKAYQKARQDPHHDIDAQTADQIANAMKEWALSKGATHFTHWFHPMTGATGEKHDSFLNYSRKDNKFIIEFSGRELIKGEPDASSFPSGGVRVTFEARGYTVWDMSSPAFVKRGANGSSLYIPTAFCSWTGEALDTKTPLLRSEEAISRECTRLLKVIGESDVEFVRTTMGPEQEFFLIDRGYYLSRPDLVAVGRTVIGAPPNKGQESEYHYFGAIDQRVLACLQELEIELWKLGIPVKTRHNEVAPSQFEMAPIYEGSVIAADHNLLAMDVLREVAAKHGLACLLHEKPFSYVNGSGKHLNWSLETSKKENLLEPGATPRDNQRFILFLAVILRAIHLHGEMLRAVIAVPGNTHRLGANEAPPVIISAYLGSELDAACKSVMAADSSAANGNAQNVLRLGVSNLPPLPRDPSDRNRTSPFAFTGNKFEFRACGSSQNISFPITVVNSIISDSVRYFADEIEKRVASGTARTQAINSLIIEELKKHYAVVFNGNGYSEEWIHEAVKRGLPLLKTAPEALAVWDKPEALRIFKEQGVLSTVEASSRSLVLHEAFFETMLTEARVMVDLASTRVTPATVNYQRQLARSYNDALAVLKDEKLFVNQKSALSSVTALLEKLIHSTNELREILHKAEADAKKGDFRKALSTWYEPVMGAMPKVRSACDHLEQILSDDLWPLAKYSEIFLTSK